MSDGVAFDRASAKRIANAVRKMEGSLPPGGGGGGAPPGFGGWRLPMWLLKVTAPEEDGPGKYQGKSFGPRGTRPAKTGALVAADLGTISTAVDVLFFNLEECDRTGTDEDTHLLTKGGITPFALGMLVGYTEESPPRKIIVGYSITVGCS